jgi:hypothetical protein
VLLALYLLDNLFVLITCVVCAERHRDRNNTCGGAISDAVAHANNNPIKTPPSAGVSVLLALHLLL